jgi:hypothetical protein
LQYEVNDQVTLRVSVQGAEGVALPQAGVDLLVATPDGQSIRRTGRLQEEPGRAGEAIFIAHFDADTAGHYAIQATATVDDKTLGTDKLQVRVTQPLIEFALTDPDHELLRELAELSGGKVLQPTLLADLARIVPLQPRKVLVQPNADEDAQPVWDRWWLLTLFVLLVGTEWFIRRKNQWV